MGCFFQKLSYFSTVDEILLLDHTYWLLCSVGRPYPHGLLPSSCSSRAHHHRHDLLPHSTRRRTLVGVITPLSLSSCLTSMDSLAASATVHRTYTTATLSLPPSPSRTAFPRSVPTSLNSSILTLMNGYLPYIPYTITRNSCCKNVRNKNNWC